tara:strand:+ start:620 stop:1093 length:474 start_codon:yes stop_codon:yes gene_type:complete
MNRKAKGPGFTQRSGKSPAFKMMSSSSPVKQAPRRFDTVAEAMAYANAQRNKPFDPSDYDVNEKMVDGTKMYRWGKRRWSSAGPYDPDAHGVAHHGSGGQYFDMYGQKATSGIEELQNRQNRGRRRRGTARQVFFGGNKPDTLSNLSTEDFWSQYSF